MYDVIVVGAGPAGSSISSHLARMGCSVLLLEKHVMPRDKLCGEFLSPEVADLCARLGVLGQMRAAGARDISVLRCASRSGIRADISLPRPAIALSRFAFDQILVAHAGASGAHVLEGVTVRRIEGDLDAGFAVETDDSTMYSRMVVGAYGRNSPLDRALGRLQTNGTAKVVAFKAHFDGSPSGRRIELFGLPGGYCGMLDEEQGQINVCWMAPSSVLKSVGGTPENMFAWMGDHNPRLRERAADLSPTEPYQAVASLTFRAKGPFASDVCMIGDAAGMIAPLCGDGIGMALRAAEVASPLAHAFLKERIDARGFRAAYTRAWSREFRQRMRLGRILQSALTRAPIGDLAARLVRAAPGLAIPIFHATRG